MMKRTPFYTLALLVLAAALIAGCGQPSQQELEQELVEAQQAQDPERAVSVYERIVDYYPEGNLAPKAQFMIGYLYANELADTALARKAYEAFLQQYSEQADSALIISAKIELRTLGQGEEAFERMILEQDEEGSGAQ